MPLTLPYTIVNGQAIDATPVMADLNALAALTPVGAAVAAAAGANSDITSLTGLTTPLAVTEGGTGANAAAGARTNLGAAASGANSDITSLTGLTTPLAVTEGGTGDAGTQWSTQTVTPVSGTGTLTTASAVWRFKVIGKTAFFQLKISITTNGTGATNLGVPLPTGWTAKADSAFAGRESLVTGKAVTGFCAAGTTTLGAISYYDATYSGGNGTANLLTGVLELT